MEIYPPKKVKVVNIKGKGKGVVATDEIRPGEVIEICPFLILSDTDAEHVVGKSDLLKFYALQLTAINKQVLMYSGYGMVYNHSFMPNSELDYQPGESVVVFRALTGIAVGQEITINYNFDDNKEEFLPLD